jgi:hypothetical protein
MEGSCEFCNEPSCSVKCWDIREKLSDWLLLKDLALCSSLEEFILGHFGRRRGTFSS